MLSNLSKEEWDKKVIDLHGSILQSWNWGEFQKSLGFGVYRFSSSDYLNQILEIPLMAGKKYLYSGRGPLGNVSLAQKDLKDLSVKDHSIVFARIEPAEKIDLPKAVKETQPTNNWLIDLEQTEDQILIGMKPKTRYNINLSQRKGVTVRQGRKEDLIEVYKLLLETAGRNKFRLHPQNYYWQIWENLAPDSLKILIAEKDGKFLACMLLTLFGSTATYLHGGSSSQMKEAMAPYVLHWEAIKLSKKLGYKYYDFGGIAPEGQADHIWSGISRFKRSFGGFELVYPGSFEIIYAPLWYNVYKNARNLVRKLKIS
jgi:lipid II:glycine glycyltransferase (peptidoglycan interpeptide bridge formation enzyme)